MNAFAHGSDLDVVRESGQLNTRSSEFEQPDNIPDPTPNGSDQDPFTSDVVRECWQLNTCSRNISDNIPDPSPVTPQDSGGKNTVKLAKFYLRREELNIPTNCRWEIPQIHHRYPTAGLSGKNTINLIKFFFKREELDIQTNCGWEMP